MFMSRDMRSVCELGAGKLRACLVSFLKLTFSHFKQHYTHFHTLFHPHVFQKTTNITFQITLRNTPLVSKLETKNSEFCQRLKKVLIEKLRKNSFLLVCLLMHLGPPARISGEFHL